MTRRFVQHIFVFALPSLYLSSDWRSFCSPNQCVNLQECRTVTTARKVMEAKGVAHYFDMLVKAAEGLPIV